MRHRHDNPDLDQRTVTDTDAHTATHTDAQRHNPYGSHQHARLPTATNRAADSDGARRDPGPNRPAGTHGPVPLAHHP